MYGTQAFYMRQNEDGKTVAAMDLLVPKVHICPTRRGQACINIVEPDPVPETPSLPRRFSHSFVVQILSPRTCISMPAPIHSPPMPRTAPPMMPPSF
jgi:hypothetical protein